MMVVSRSTRAVKFPLTSLFLLAALGTPASPAQGADDAGFISEEAELQFNVMAGELAAQRREPAVAAGHFLKVIKLRPDPALAMRTTALALVGKDDVVALAAARIWADAAPDEPEPKSAVMRLALRNRLETEALERAAGVVEAHPQGKAAGLRHVAQVLSQETARKKEALSVMAALRTRHAADPGAHYAQALMALRFDELELAERAAREALRLDGKSPDTLLLLTGVLVKRGDFAAGDETFARLIKVSDEPAAMHAGYARLLLEAEQIGKSRAQYLKALDVDPELTEARYALGLLALEQEDLVAAEAQFKVLLQSDSARFQAAYYLGRIEETRKNYTKALAWYEQVTEGDSALDAVVRRAAVMGRTGRLDDGRELLSQMRYNNPQFSNRFYLAEGELLLEADKGDEALALYESALSESPGDAELLYGRSLVHERLDNFRQAEADLRTILDADPEDARAMNALGYMLTVRNSRLKEARKLITRALELNPDDAAVIDSMGWIEFRQGKLHEALRLLEKAFDKAKDPEIAAHLGEVLWKLGQRQRAREIWEAALSRDPEHKVLKETFERLAR